MELIIKNISKTYSNGVRALQDVNLEIPSGMFGLLGPNSAGKSTLMRILATLLQPDSGSIRLNGLDLLTQPLQVRRMLGYLPQEFGVYPELSAARMLHHLAVLKGMTDRRLRSLFVDEILERTNLTAVKKRRLGAFSGGMKRRFGIAQALLGNPRFLIVDEPTAGLDPEERRRFYNLLSEVSESRIVLLSTHIVEDVHVLCPRMAILDQGRVRFDGSPHAALDQLKGRLWRKTVQQSEWEVFSGCYNVVQTYRSAGNLYAHVFCSHQPGDFFEPVDPGLEDAYFYTLHFNTRGVRETACHVA